MKNKLVSQWNRLDNAAKIFPSNSGKRDTKVFRFACQLKESIEVDALQEALNRTLEVFPLFRSVIKKGLFWYYLEYSKKIAVVKEENSPPCGPLYDRNVKSLLFQVSYYKRRINFEVYHVLTDGTGALQFFKTLLHYYLSITKEKELWGKKVVLDYDASLIQRMDDSFKRYYDDSQKIHEEKEEGKKKKAKTAYKLKGSKLPEYRMEVIEGTVPVQEVISKAREYNTTVTVFVVALIMCSIAEDMTVREKKNPVVVTVPVNLRNYFDSVSARNFFGVVKVGYDFKNGSGELSEVMEYIGQRLKTELTTGQLSKRMQKLGALENNIFARITPLVIKNIFMKIGYRISNRKETFSVSNMGAIKMPEELETYIQGFDVFVSTKKQQMCMCSYGGHLTMSFTSALISTEIQKRFFRKLSAMGIKVEIATNQGFEE